MPGGIAIDARGRISVALTMMKPADLAESIWAHPTSEIVWLESPDGGETFTAKRISTPEPPRPHWLPNLERPTGHNRVRVPGLIYTAGTRGKDNRDIVSNEVHWVSARA